MSRIAISAFIFIFLNIPLQAEDATRNMEASIRFLADDHLEGRGTASRGLDIAALYLATQLQRYGWEPANNGSYLQTYSLKEYSPQQASYTIAINGKELQKDEFLFIPWGMDPEKTPVRYDLVFAGHGVVASEKQVDDLRGLDVKEKAVVALLGAPWKLDPTTPFGYDRAVGKGIEATSRGAKMLVYVTNELRKEPATAERLLFHEGVDVPIAYLPEFEGKPTFGFGPMLAITDSAFDRIFDGHAKYTELQKRLEAKSSNVSNAIKGSIEIKITAKPSAASASNVVATLKGSDPQLSEEWVVLTAHYDHLGSHPVAEGEDGIWNGADDNASGTAAVLEIARQLALGPPPKRSVMVLLTSGEERGLLGSAHYSIHPLIPYNNVVVDINVDMVGRSTGNVQGIAHGSEILYQQAKEIGQKFQIDVLPDQNPSWRILYLTDHYHFARFNVPAIEFFTGIHPDYHMPTDSVEKIRFPELGRIVTVMSGLARFYAEGGQKPAFHRPAWFLTP